MNAVKRVLIDSTNGATTTDGSKLSANVLSHIVEAVSSQVNQEFAAEWGAVATLRVGANAKDIKPGEWAYVFLPSLPDAPGHGGNYQIISKAAAGKQVFAAGHQSHIEGIRRKGPVPNWSSRAGRRLANVVNMN